MYDNNLKIFITGPISCRIHDFTKFIAESYPEMFSYGKLTTTDMDAGEGYSYFTENQINEIFLNRQFIFLHNGTGLTTVELEEHNLFSVSFEELILIPNKVWSKNNTLIIVLYPEDNWENKELDMTSFEVRDLLKSEKKLMHHIKEVLEMNDFIVTKGFTFLEIFARIIKYIEANSLKIHKKILDYEIPDFPCYKL